MPKIETADLGPSAEVTNDNVNQYLYDGEGHICAEASTPVPGMTVMTGYLYDGDGNRVAKGTITSWSCDPSVNGFTTAGDETDYVLGLTGEQVTEVAQNADGSMNWQRTYVYAGSNLVATYNPSPDPPNQPLPSFRVTDWLGTMRATTDSNGVLQGTCTGLPFGDDVQCAGDIPDPHHFTGKERDSESGNDYFGARYMASSMGRFLSPDPLGNFVADVSNPQTWNMYAYALNNPLKFIDPTGYDRAYLNDAGDGFESLDQQSNSQECTQNGGYWADGAITNFQANSNGGYTFTSLDTNLNTLTTNFSGGGNTGSTSSLDVMSYFYNYQIQQKQAQQMPDASLTLAQGIAKNTGNLSVGLDCATEAGLIGAGSYLGISAPTPNPARQVAESSSAVVGVAGSEGVGAMAANTVSALGPKVAGAVGAFAEKNVSKVAPFALAVQGGLAAKDAINAYKACNGQQ